MAGCRTSPTRRLDGTPQRNAHAELHSAGDGEEQEHRPAGARTRRLPARRPGDQAGRRRRHAAARARVRRVSRRSTRRVTATTTSRSCYSASACTSASPGRRTSTAMCSATSRTRARRSTIRRCGATSSGDRPRLPHRSIRPRRADASARPAPRPPAWPCRGIHNHLVRERPDLAASLYDPCPTTPAASKPRRAGVLRCRPSPNTAGASRALHPAVHPRLSATPTPPGPDPHGGNRRRLRSGQRSGLQRVHGLQPGEIQFIRQLPRAPRAHRLRRRRGARLQRHLKRLWLATYALTDRPAYFAGRSDGAATGRPGAPSARCRRSSGAVPRAADRWDLGWRASRPVVDRPGTGG